MDEHDRLVRACRSGLAQRGGDPADAQLAVANRGDGLAPAVRARAAQDAQCGPRAQHVPRGLAHAHDGDEGAGHRGVVLGDRAQAAQVGVDHPHAQRA